MLNADGVLWAGVKDGLWRYNDSGWESVAGVTGWISAIHESRDGTLWVIGISLFELPLEGDPFGLPPLSLITACGAMTVIAGNRLMGDLVRSRLSMKVETVRSRLVEGMDCGVKRVLAKMRSGFILIWLITI